MMISGVASGLDEENAIGTIHKMDLSQPEGPKAPGHSIVKLDLKSLKVPRAHAHVVFNQLTKRVRVEFEGAGLPKASYVLATAADCASKELGPSWRQVHRFRAETEHVATEKSHRDLTLKDLQGKSVGFFQLRGAKAHRIDCKPI